MSGFNQPTPAEHERLALMLEELGEAQQAIGKILRYGYEEYSPFDDMKTTNRVALEKELAQEIPISEAKRIAEKYGYDQVVILSTSATAPGGATAFNTDKKKCGFLRKAAAMLHTNLRSFYADESVAMDYYRQMQAATGQNDDK
jgi:hypothetical protein